MIVKDLSLSGAKVIYPKVFNDERGFFFESFNEEKYIDAGIDCKFVQDNHSKSSMGTIRGLHYQSDPGQAKLLRVVNGKIYDVIVDIRPDSGTFGKYEGVYLDDQSHGQIFIPHGFAHGFSVLSAEAEVCYKVSNLYNAKTECSLKWNDQDIGIVWPIELDFGSVIVSDRDKCAESFIDYKKRILK